MSSGSWRSKNALPKRGLSTSDTGKWYCRDDWFSLKNPPGDAVHQSPGRFFTNKLRSKQKGFSKFGRAIFRIVSVGTHDVDKTLFQQFGGEPLHFFSPFSQKTLRRHLDKHSATNPFFQLLGMIPHERVPFGMRHHGCHPQALHLKKKSV